MKNVPGAPNAFGVSYPGSLAESNLLSSLLGRAEPTLCAGSVAADNCMTAAVTLYPG